MYSRILVPLDGSDMAASVLPIVKQLAIGLKIPVQLIGVIEPVIDPPPAGRLAGWNPRTILAEKVKLREDHMRQVADHLGLRDGAVSWAVHMGDAAAAILGEVGVQPRNVDRHVHPRALWDNTLPHGQRRYKGASWL